MMGTILELMLAAFLLMVLWVGNNSINLKYQQDKLLISATGGPEVSEDIRRYRVKAQKKIKQIQLKLAEAGHYQAEVDGNFRFQVTEAIKAFQKSKGLKADGIVDKRTWEELERPFTQE